MKKANNRILLIALVALVAIFVVTRLVRDPRRRTNLDASAFRLDTAEITALRIKTGDSAEITLARDGREWKALRGNMQARANETRVSNALSALARIKPERIVTRNRDRWNDYQVGDSASVRVEVVADDETVLSLNVGAETGGATYARISEADDVYSIDGYLREPFNFPFSDWRDQTVIRVNRNAVTRVDFQYSDSSFVLEQKNGKWYIGNDAADSAKVQDYLSGISSVNHDVFADDFSADSQPTATIVISSGGDKVTVEGWKVSFDHWIFRSSQQPGTFFSDFGPRIASDIIASRKQFAVTRE